MRTFHTASEGEFPEVRGYILRPPCPGPGWIGPEDRLTDHRTGGTLYLLVGMLTCALALLSDASIRSYAGIGGEALFAVIFGLLSLFAATVLPEPAKTLKR